MILDDILVILLAGGAGERLYPLTKDRAKPAVYFGGPYRIVDFTLSNCINSGLRRIFIATQYKSLSLNRHIRMGWNVVSEELGEFIEILAPQKRVGEHWYLGTADAVYQNLYSDHPRGAEPRDRAVRRPRLQDGLREDASLPSGKERRRDPRHDRGAGQRRQPLRHRRRRRVGARRRVSGEADRSAARRRARAMSRWPRWASTSSRRTCWCGRWRRTPTRADSEHDFGRNILPALIQTRPVYSYRFYDENKKSAKYWRDIGTLDAYFDASMDLCQVNPEFNLYDPEWPLRTYQPQAPPAKFVFAEEGRRCGQALDSIISSGCIISGSRVSGSILCPNVRVHSFCDIDQAILMPGVRVGRHARIHRAIIDRDVLIPRGALIGFDPEEDRRRHTVTEGGVVVVTADDDPLIGPISDDALRAEADADRGGAASA